MRKTILFKSFLSFLIAVVVVSCDNQPKFTVEGQVTDADSAVIYLEKRGLTDVTVLDSVTIGQDGQFKFKSLAPESPDLYVLRLNGQIINLAIDSTEVVTVNSSRKDFATAYTVEGSEGSKRIKQTVTAYYRLLISVNSLKSQFSSKSISEEDYLNQVRTDLNAYKDEAKKIIIADLKSPSAYFTLFQKIDDVLLFDPYDKQDSKMYGAVATAWDTYYEGTPRAKHLHSFTVSAMKINRQANSGNSLLDLDNLSVANQTDVLEINLPDIKGNNVALSSLKGKVVLLDFTSYQTEYSPQHNILINKLYTKFKGSLEVYQVSFDSSLHLWQNATTNIPWICVRDSKSLDSELLSKYNISGLPTAFLLNRDGDIVKRLSDSDNIESEIQKLL